MDFKPVSIVIPCYNKKAALRKTLEATLGQIQVYRGDEVIVADGKSTDGVEKMLDRDFMPEVQFVQVEERKEYNLNTVRNLGIREATNDIIIILDADCIPQPNYIDPLQPNCIDTFREKSQRGVYLSGVIAYEVPYEQQLKQAKKHDGRATAMIMFQNYPIEEIIKRVEEDSDDVRGTIGSCMCFSKQDALDVGLFDEDYNGCWGYDETDLIIKLYFNGVKLVNLTRMSTGLAIALHQRHKFNKKWQDKCVKRNRAILKSKLPLYKQKIFPEVKT